MANLKARIKFLESQLKSKPAIDKNPEYTEYLKNLSNDDLNALYQTFEILPTLPNLQKLFKTASDQDIINLYIQGCKTL